MRTTLLFLAACSVSVAAESAISFLPAVPHAVVTFEGITQAGKATHRLEVRRLTYFHSELRKQVEVFANGGYYIIYFAGDDYGPEILEALGGIDPLVRLAEPGLVEIFYIAGAHTHIRERWRLTGSSAKRESRDEIEWTADPRTKKHAETP